MISAPRWNTRALGGDLVSSYTGGISMLDVRRAINQSINQTSKHFSDDFTHAVLTGGVSVLGDIIKMN